MARLLSANVGLPSDVTWQGRTVGYRPDPVDAPADGNAADLLFAAWQQGRRDLFYPYGKTYVQTLGEQD
jgi:hypothetical protein